MFTFRHSHTSLLTEKLDFPSTSKHPSRIMAHRSSIRFLKWQEEQCINMSSYIQNPLLHFLKSNNKQMSRVCYVVMHHSASNWTSYTVSLTHFNIHYQHKLYFSVRVYIESHYGWLIVAENIHIVNILSFSPPKALQLRLFCSSSFSFMIKSSRKDFFWVLFFFQPDQHINNNTNPHRPCWSITASQFLFFHRLGNNPTLLYIARPV